MTYYYPKMVIYGSAAVIVIAPLTRDRVPNYRNGNFSEAHRRQASQCVKISFPRAPRGCSPVLLLDQTGAYCRAALASDQGYYFTATV